MAYLNQAHVQHGGRSSWRWLLVVFAITLGLLVGASGSTTLAQDAPAETHAAEGELVPHPAHIVTGTCLAQGEIKASLGWASEILNDPVGAVPNVHVDAASVGLFFTLDELLAEDLAVVVRNSDDDPDTLIACGEFGGHFVGATLVVGLAAVGDSGFAGAALVTDGADGTIDLELYLTNVNGALVDSDG